MSDPLVEPEDLATYLNDDRLDENRAAGMIADAQALCESIVSPLPAAAYVVVKRVAGRGYVSTLTPKQAQAQAAGGMFGGSVSGGVWLTKTDKADLRRFAGGGSGAFSIDVLPVGYVAPVSYVDEDATGDWDVAQ